jgi:hypothetical protein
MAHPISRTLRGLLIACALCSAIPAVSGAAEIEPRGAAPDAPVSPQEMMLAPLEAVLESFARSPRELVTLRFVYYQLTVKSLAELMFLPDPQGEVDFSDLSPAIAAYQLALGAEPTGKLLFGQYDQLLHRAMYVQRRNMGPMSMKRVDIAAPQPGPVSLKGSWREEASASAANVTEIRCRPPEQRCTEAHAQVGRSGLDSTLREWRVVEWSSQRLLAVSEDDPCLAQSLAVDLRSGRSEMVHTPSSDEAACRSSGTAARRFHLVASYQLFSEITDDPMQEYMNPAATRRLGASGQ